MNVDFNLVPRVLMYEYMILQCKYNIPLVDTLVMETAVCLVPPYGRSGREPRYHATYWGDTYDIIFPPACALVGLLVSYETRTIM